MELLQFIKTHKELCEKEPNYAFLHIAAAAQHVDYFAICLEVGVDVNLNFDGVTPAHILFNRPERIHEGCFNRLLQYTANLTIVDKCKRTAFDYLIINNHFSNIKELLVIQPKSAIRAYVSNRIRPLMLAYTHNQFDIFQLLIENGGNPFLKFDEDSSASKTKSSLLSHIIFNQALAYMDLIIKHPDFNQKQTSVFKEAMERGKTQLLEHLQKQVNVHSVPDKFGNTIVHYSCMYGYHEIGSKWRRYKCMQSEWGYTFSFSM